SAQVERQEQDPDRHRDRDDRGDGGHGAENGREETGKPGDKVIRGVHGDAKETEHVTTAFQLRRDGGWRRPRGPRVSEKGPGTRPPGPRRALVVWPARPRRGHAGAGPPPARTSPAAPRRGGSSGGRRC